MWQTIDYGYNVAGERVYRWERSWNSNSPQTVSSQSVRRYALDGQHVVAVTTSGGSVLTRYTYASGTDQVLSVEDTSGNGEWFLGNRQGTVTDSVEIGSSTPTTQHIEYNTYGGMTTQPTGLWGSSNGITPQGDCITIGTAREARGVNFWRY